MVCPPDVHYNQLQHTTGGANMLAVESIARALAKLNALWPTEDKPPLGLTMEWKQPPEVVQVPAGDPAQNPEQNPEQNQKQNPKQKH